MSQIMTKDKATPKAEIISLDDLYREAQRLDVTPGWVPRGLRTVSEGCGPARFVIRLEWRREF